MEGQLREQIASLEMQLQQFEGVSVQILKLETLLQKQQKEFQTKMLEKDEKLAHLQMQLSKANTPKTASSSSSSPAVVVVQKGAAGEEEEEEARKQQIVQLLQENEVLKKRVEEVEGKLQMEMMEKETPKPQVLLDSVEVEELKRKTVLQEGLLRQKDETIFRLQNQVAERQHDSGANVEQMTKLLEAKNLEVVNLRSEIARLQSENLNIRRAQVEGFSKMAVELKTFEDEKSFLFPGAENPGVQTMSETEEEYDEEILVDDDSVDVPPPARNVQPPPVVEEDKREEAKTEIFEEEDDFLSNKKEKKSLVPEPVLKKDGSDVQKKDVWDDDDDDKPPPTLFGKLKWLAGIGRKKVKKADLSQDTSFVFDPLTKKWVDKNAKKTGAPSQKSSAPPVPKLSTIEDEAKGPLPPPAGSRPSPRTPPSVGRPGGPPPPARFGQGPAAVRRPQYLLVGPRAAPPAASAGARPRARPKPVVQAIQGEPLPPEPVQEVEPVQAASLVSEGETPAPASAKKQKKVIVKKKRKVMRPSKKRQEQGAQAVPAPRKAPTQIIRQQEPLPARSSEQEQKVVQLLGELESSLSYILTRKPYQASSSSSHVSSSSQAELSISISVSRVFL